MAREGRERVRVIVLTGGPGGGKSALLRRVSGSPLLRDRVATLQEAIHWMGFVPLRPRSQEFQCALVAVQAASEAALAQALANTEKRVIVCDRGTLDPCAFWQSFGNSRQSFFEMTGTTLEDHYRRYDLVIHLESAAVRVPEAYLRYPIAHRPEQTAEAARLDAYLGELWSGHPDYAKIEGTKAVSEKVSRALALVGALLGSG